MMAFFFTFNDFNSYRPLKLTARVLMHYITTQTLFYYRMRALGALNVMLQTKHVEVHVRARGSYAFLQFS